ncbi:Ppx/GppA phosphatase family protein [Rhizobium sp. SSA_523]|uniref:Ppx/GppA phosphatase family protein n=1 Tax=Rhizobium sp. SSA_523 TaxID=2952477 RepID=UPI0020911250|nr:Ppx/GppA family phosphatase [Rhizobium sp. SSA_523]MCO5733142.1 Ppx/GppA family phosphatase [Rhizobium sp. SSA_523]WKC25830.1 Ppx/GppA family phosphatase [Rhizobium sp. SSA_523]
MMNPDSGGKPPEGGASTTGRSGKKSRRRKGRRDATASAAAPVAHGSETAESRAVRRPDTEDNKAPRKRKRRRARAAERQRPKTAEASAAAGRGADASRPDAQRPDVQRPEAQRQDSHRSDRPRPDHQRADSQRADGQRHGHPHRETAAHGEPAQADPPHIVSHHGAARGSDPARAHPAHAQASDPHVSDHQALKAHGPARPEDTDGRARNGRRRGRGRKKGEARGPQGRPLVPQPKAPGERSAAERGPAFRQGHNPGHGSGQNAGHGPGHAPAQGQAHPHGHSHSAAAGGARASGAREAHSRHAQTKSHPGALPHDRPHGPRASHEARDHREHRDNRDHRDHRARGRDEMEAGDPARRRSGAEDLYAALDLGTNNCRLLIAQPTRPGQFRVVDAFSRIVRLGEGLARTGRLSDDAMDRAVEALRICAAKLATRQIRRMRLIATEACRAAENGEEFLQRVTEETGLALEIIDRETEARLAVSGCSSLVGREARSVVLFDIGGGSSEIAVIRIKDNRSSRLANHITHWTSLPVGVVTLSERHGGRNVTPDVFAAMVAEVESMLEGFQCPPLVGREDDFHLIGTSGTVTTLAGVHLDLQRYDRRKVDGLWLSDHEVSAMQARLLSWDFDGRAANPCIGPDRADLVLAGCAILEAIRRRWPSRRMRVADRGLREGLLTDMMADDGVWRRLRRRSMESASQTGTAPGETAGLQQDLAEKSR